MARGVAGRHLLLSAAVPSFSELDAFAESAAALDATLGSVNDGDWTRPGLGEWTLAELVAHVIGGVARVEEYLDVDPGGAQPACDRVSYWDGVAAAAPQVAARARARAAMMPPATMPAAFSETWRRAAERASLLAPDHLMASLRGPMRLDEYLATRVVELVVHHLDVRAALDLPPGTSPAAGRLVVDVLERLLGDSRPRNLGRDRFMLVATGRLRSDDPRFPLLT